MDNTIYAKTGSKRFNDWFGGVIRTLGREYGELMEDNFVALVLGGSYGAGDGAVVTTESGDRPYHDIDLYPLVIRHDPKLHRRFKTVAKKYEERFGVVMDVKPLLLERDILNLKPELSYWDLLHRYIVIAGDETIFERNLPKWFYHQPPEQEASRLLLRHGSSLLECMRVLRGIAAEPDSEFVRRSYWKCAFALGDALLVANGRYSAETDTRIANLAELLESREEFKSVDFLGMYEKSAEFRLKPGSVPKKRPEIKDIEELTWKWGSVFLSIEKKRLKGTWKNLEEYCFYGGRRESNLYGTKGLIRNFLFALHNGRISIAHPREIVYTRILGLLGLTTSELGDAEWTNASERLLAYMAKWK